MATAPPEPLRPGEPPARCSHPWLRVTCGVCGAAVDELREAPERPAPGSETEGDSPTPSPPAPAQKLFIVARGHPELVEQLKALLGESESIRVIEDRRRTSRPPAPPDDGTPSIRTEYRRRVFGSEPPEGE